MKSFVRNLLCVCVLAWIACAQDSPLHGTSSVPVANLKSIRYVVEANGPAIEIVSNWPVVPSIRLIDSPWRLLIDIPNSRIGKARKEQSVKKEYVTEIRADQYQEDPPVTRIVLDLIAPYGATWDSAGNRLMVRLKPANDPAATRTVTPVPTVAALTRQPAPVVIPVTSGSGPISLAGSALAAGSTISAGEETAVLNVTRGGEIRVCPKTTVAITASKNSSELMVSLSTGAMETHYHLDATADSVMTPDFRILFPGPGDFHYAISTDANGDTCVRGLSGNTSPVVVSELLGDRKYQVKPFEQAVFRGGQIDRLDTNVPLECGCPPPPAVLRAGVNTQQPVTPLPSNVELSQGATKPPANTVLEASAATAANNAPPATTPDTAAATPAPAPATPAPTTAPDNNPAPESAATVPAPAPTVAENTPPPAPPAAATLSNGPEVAPPPVTKPKDVVHVDTPLVFSAKNRRSGTPPPPPVFPATAAPIMRPAPASVHLDTKVLPPPKGKKNKGDADQPAQEQNPGFFHKVKNFFKAIL